MRRQCASLKRTTQYTQSLTPRWCPPARYHDTLEHGPEQKRFHCKKKHLSNYSKGLQHISPEGQLSHHVSPRLSVIFWNSALLLHCSMCFSRSLARPVHRHRIVSSAALGHSTSLLRNRAGKCPMEVLRETRIYYASITYIYKFEIVAMLDH